MLGGGGGSVAIGHYRLFVWATMVGTCVLSVVANSRWIGRYVSYGT